jgi:hypothetical protein
MLMCQGNHDTYVPWPYVSHPVANYIKSRYGEQFYVREVNSVVFICCGIYPDKDVLPWLTEQLKSAGTKPVIVWFHYNLWGEYSDFWSEQEKQAFLETITVRN